jgi:hypothetical protein
MLTANIFLLQFPRVLLLTLLLISTDQEAWSETFSVQAGIYKNVKNAEKRYASLLKSLLEKLQNNLRIEKSGDLYAVWIGRFETRDQAERLLPSVKSISPDAFIRKGEFVSENILKMKKKHFDSLPVQSPEKRLPVSTLPPSDEKPTWKVVKPIPSQ